jgi:hypothetical protein
LREKPTAKSGPNILSNLLIHCLHSAKEILKKLLRFFSSTKRSANSGPFCEKLKLIKICNCVPFQGLKRQILEEATKNQIEVNLQNEKLENVVVLFVISMQGPFFDFKVFQEAYAKCSREALEFLRNLDREAAESNTMES